MLPMSKRGGIEHVTPVGVQLRSCTVSREDLRHPFVRSRSERLIDENGVKMCHGRSTPRGSPESELFEQPAVQEFVEWFEDDDDDDDDDDEEDEDDGEEDDDDDEEASTEEDD